MQRHPRVLRVRARFLTVVVLACIGMIGCTASETRRAPEKNATVRTEDIKVTTQQLRLRMRSLVGPMCGKIEQAADAVIAGSDDATVKLAALKWKIDGVPAMREALFMPDPYTAAMDTAVLCCQMTNYFETGPGKEELGPASAQAADACRRMTDDYFKVVASGTTSGDVSKGRAFVEKWAADHPIRHSIADRESALARVYEQEFTGSQTTTEFVADAEATADDLNRKVDVYSSQLFRQARWEVERLRLELVRDYRVDQAVPLAERAVKSAEQAVATIDRLAPALERTLSVAQDLPKLVAAERTAAIKAAHEELEAQRVAALAEVRKERIQLSQHLHDALADQAQQLASDVDRISAQRIDYVINKVVWLVAGTMAVVLIAALLGLVFVRRMLVRLPTPSQRREDPARKSP